MNGLILIEDFEKFKHGMELFLKPPDFSVGTTPSEMIFREDKMKLIHYIPTVEKPHPVPILIVYALVNRYYILDLQPDKSIIKKLLDEGFDVYIIDWGYPSGVDRYLTLDDYVNGYINNAVDTVSPKKTQIIKKVTRYRNILILGYALRNSYRANIKFT